MRNRALAGGGLSWRLNAHAYLGQQESPSVGQLQRRVESGNGQRVLAPCGMNATQNASSRCACRVAVLVTVGQIRPCPTESVTQAMVLLIHFGAERAG